MNAVGLLVSKDNPLGTQKTDSKDDVKKQTVLISDRIPLQKKIEDWLGVPISTMNVLATYNIITNIVGIVDSHNISAFTIVTDFISSIFSPIVPALAGTGMVKALLAFLVAFSRINTSGSTFRILDMIGDATFAFMSYSEYITESLL